eukprot:SAG22_NODE_5868_length_939_cov_1.189286_1_plen_300_part_10
MSALSGGCALYPSERGADAWYPDILLDDSHRPSVPLPAGRAQPLWITAQVRDTALPGNHTAMVRVHDVQSGELVAEVTVRLTVWNLSVTGQLRAFPDVAEFGAGYLAKFYPANASVRTDPDVALLADAQVAFDAEMCAHRMPPNTWTASRDGAGLKMLADPAQCDEKYFVVFNIAPPSLNTSAAFVAEQLAHIAPRVALAEANGLLGNSVVYGFDEAHEDHVQAIVALFGAIKKRWPKLRTMAALNFAVDQRLYPVLDIWVVEYWNYDDRSCDHRPMRSAIDQWRSASNPNPNKEHWGYH